MKVLITGGSGLVGGRLTEILKSDGHQVAHLNRSKSEAIETFIWDINKGYIEDGAFEDVDALVHLAGASVADGRWTDSRKQIIIDSRVKTTNLLYDTIREGKGQLKSVVTASAVGYYGMQTGDELMTEASDNGNDFLAHVVKLWENSTNEIRNLGIPTTQLRIGIVLDESGGALGKMQLPIKLGIGSPIGTGKQWMSWIHIDDLCRMIIHAINNQLNDVYNAVGHSPKTNEELTKELAAALSRPVFMPNVPSFVIKAMFGEMAQMILGGNKVSSKKIEESGFSFNFPELDKAFQQIYG
ncbi:MAG: TIGR01777 family oxidoreductase [Cyclobacteriaceae bacterium]